MAGSRPRRDLPRRDDRSRRARGGDRREDRLPWGPGLRRRRPVDAGDRRTEALGVPLGAARPLGLLGPRRAARGRGGRAFDGALLDLGISSVQLDDPARGLSFRAEGPSTCGGIRTAAADGGRNPPRHAGEGTCRPLLSIRRGAVLPADRPRGGGRRRREPIRTTTALAELVSSAIPRKAWPRDIHPATRVFQALRIAVNRELSSLGRSSTRSPGTSLPEGGWR